MIADTVKPILASDSFSKLTVETDSLQQLKRMTQGLGKPEIAHEQTKAEMMQELVKAEMMQGLVKAELSQGELKTDMSQGILKSQKFKF